MKVKPIISLKENETVQHHSGILDKAITRKQLEQNPNMVRTHAHLFANAKEIMREDAMSGKVVATVPSSLVKIEKAMKENGEKSILIFGAPKQGNDNQKAQAAAMAILQKMNAESKARSLANSDAEKKAAEAKAKADAKAEKERLDSEAKAAKEAAKNNPPKN